MVARVAHYVNYLRVGVQWLQERRGPGGGEDCLLFVCELVSARRVASFAMLTLLTALFRRLIRTQNKGSYYKSAHWLGLRRELIGPDTRCTDCGTRNTPQNPLQLDHRYYYRDGQSVYYRERRYPGCLQVRCRSCHQRRHRRNFS